MAFALVTFVLLTYMAGLPILSLIVPALVDTLPHMLGSLTAWTRIEVIRNGELFVTLSLRFIVINTVILGAVFLARPPKRIIERGDAGDFHTSKVIPLRWYGQILLGCFLASRLFCFFYASSDKAGTGQGSLVTLGVVLGLTAVLTFFHGFFLYFLLGFWNIGCELVYPLLRSSSDVADKTIEA